MATVTGQGPSEHTQSRAAPPRACMARRTPGARQTAVHILSSWVLTKQSSWPHAVRRARDQHWPRSVCRAAQATPAVGVPRATSLPRPAPTQEAERSCWNIVMRSTAGRRPQLEQVPSEQEMESLGLRTTCCRSVSKSMPKDTPQKGNLITVTLEQA